ncbi:hypothetical protein G1H11_13885 [Phytoactinopolyspora alkaliphila]|uniref:Lipoprotein n=1 Tax=Phytoactinopolyspora alkaliphila TaxID=1783498 RepID=A0A6N9YN71_9ACTN|nr:DUF6624 domain-containing protein [Phytoactinopolyspora alkaliphila]NED96397.1 hypothetical protein [Phytoactinopolyspora alkaliphila]
MRASHARTRRAVHLLRASALLGCVLLAGPGCSESDDEPSGASSSHAFNQALHDELMRMLDDDQAERTGEAPMDGDQTRTDRLAEIIDEYGWPTFDLVGEDGAEAAWAIAQHSDLDPGFQERALELLRAAAAEGQASAGNLAYLEDRVAVGKGLPQLYGTQIGCGPDGAEPATPIVDPENVEQRRADAGLEPLDDYLSELNQMCPRSRSDVGERDDAGPAR